MRSEGFTLIEVLVALVMFAVVTAAAAALLLSILKTNGLTQNRLSGNSQLQQYVEQVTGDWRNASDFDRGCVTSPNWPPEVKVTAEPLQLKYSPYTVASLSNGVPSTVRACNATPATLHPALQRLTLSMIINGKPTIIRYDVGRPQ